jgi:anti-sigma regulatory factor (Ser/Thr protein kinase)
MDRKTLTGDLASIVSARREVRAMVAGYGAAGADVAELLTDELLANAVLHGGGRFVLRAELDEDLLRVAVSDEKPGAPLTVLPAGHALETGRGLTIVDAMASRWGVDRSRREKRVWFELEMSQSPPA